jgi:FlaA1/EpsC-like NDP-sugar epimerase
MWRARICMQREFDLLLSQLSPRQPLRTDPGELRPAIEGRTVLLTGAGGSIGSAVVLELASLRPGRLILLERSESDLHAITLAALRCGETACVVPILGDVCDGRLLDEVFRAHRPDLVIHAAAFKHVALLEGQPLEAARNNILGTHELVLRAAAGGAGRTVMLSTDKAVEPASIMGATKRMAELLMASFDGAGTRSTSVRFGNVIGSRGSVAPHFAGQIAAGRPLTVSHPDASRFFLSGKEAVGCVLAAVSLGRGGDILVPDLGHPIRILDLARAMIRSAGLRPEETHVPIVFTGLRPGEKLSERLLSAPEEAAASGVPGDGGWRRVVLPRVPSAEIERWIGGLRRALHRRSVSALLESVLEAVPGYVPSDTIMELASAPRAA